MTFQEADKIQKSYPSPYTINGVKCEVYITPFEHVKYEQFVNDWADSSLKELEEYIPNGKYKVTALAKSEFKVTEIEITYEN